MRKLFRNFLVSFDHEVAAKVHCSPSNATIVMVICIAIIIACRNIPFIHEEVGLRNAILPTVLIFTAWLCSIATWLGSQKSVIVAVCQFFDVALYGGALMSCALLSNPPTSYAFVCFWILAAMQWGSIFSLSVLGVASFLAGPAVVALLFPPDATIVLLMALAIMMYLFISRTTSERKKQSRAKERAQDVVVRLDALIERWQTIANNTYQDQLASVIHRAKNELAPAMWNLNFIERAVIDADDQTKSAMVDLQEGLTVLLEEMQRELQKFRSKTAYPQTFSIDDIPEDILSAMKPSCRQGQIVFEKFPNFTVAMPKESFTIALHNLVSNSLEAGSQKVIVSAHASPNDPENFVSLTVNDDGPGLPAEVQRNLFKPFNTFGKRNGAGLGIYLTRRILEVGGGTLALQKTGNQGSVFVITLPIAPVKNEMIGNLECSGRHVTNVHLG